LSRCDVPDLALLPQRYAGVRDVRFRAGMELSLLHLGLWLFAALRCLHLVPNWRRFAAALKACSDVLMHLGSDAGAMHVCVEGTTPAGKSVQRTWQLIAEQGDGPFVPALAAAALIRKMAAGTIDRRGAMPCIGLLTLEDFLREAVELHIRTETVEL
jgi:hypothetical protein